MYVALVKMLLILSRVLLMLAESDREVVPLLTIAFSTHEQVVVVLVVQHRVYG